MGTNQVTSTTPDAPVRLRARLCALMMWSAAATTFAAAPWTSLRIGSHTVIVEVAATAAARERGLAGRNAIGPDEGMLFVFSASQHPCVWMKDTQIPLAAAFITAEGKIAELVVMEPESTTLRCSRDAVRYVLELRVDWFNRHDVLPGAQVEGLEDSSSAPIGAVDAVGRARGACAPDRGAAPRELRRI